ncbi:UvrB/UvrC motif-containing protein [Carboxydothermus islandicus]|uniref:UvrB/UvrC motif-containing protein n=1 Tax=Carboxydothermus islandicus TaxID=661089 RepID=A0A1L8CZR4_9THEO|nr:UvrB/UvrC motif-containing protein [Carboxydothermus islandicus]GAV24373.1 UvrB/UvrC motif-containing protein [Carboxydothermus islandicus]
MLCERCGQNPATMHITRVVNGQKTEMNLCTQCAQELGHTFNFSPQLTFQNLLKGLMGHDVLGDFSISGGNIGVTKKCPVCGLTENQFINSGFLGCSQCYETFKDRVEQALRKIHGSTEHRGKFPAKTGGKIKILREIENLKKALNEAVSKEEFEKAAELRDKIKELEASLKE